MTGLKALRDRLPSTPDEGRRLLKTLLAGLWLAGVPTYYTLFVSRAAADPLWLRIVFFLAWLGVGVWVLWRAWSRDQSIDQAMADRLAMQREARISATSDVLAALLEPGAMGLPDSYEFTIYIYDEEQGSLEPYYPHLNLPADAEDPRRFAPGRGATGRAWQAGRLFFVRGEPVATDAFNLTETQREFFRDYRSVAATPIRDEHGTPFGVLTTLSRVDDGLFEGEAGKRLLRDLADTVGIVLTSVPNPDDLVAAH